MMGGPLIDGCNVESGQFRTLPSRKSRSWIDRMPRIVRGQACYHHHRPENPAAYPDLIEPASPAVLDARNLYRDSARKAWTASGQKERQFCDQCRRSRATTLSRKDWHSGAIGAVLSVNFGRQG